MSKFDSLTVIPRLMDASEPILKWRKTHRVISFESILSENGYKYTTSKKMHNVVTCKVKYGMTIESWMGIRCSIVCFTVECKYQTYQVIFKRGYFGIFLQKSPSYRIFVYLCSLFSIRVIEGHNMTINYSYRWLLLAG